MHTSWSPAATAGTAAGCTAGLGNICNSNEMQINNVTAVQKLSAGQCLPPDCTYQESGIEHGVVYSDDSTTGGTGSVWDKFDSYVISDAGKVATTADFAGVTSGTQFKTTLLNWNFQTIVTASEFGGRKIDLVVEPKIFIQSGLIP